ncbi:hypothetical protein VB735_30205 [Halotia wernerae UHCC 0503]|nr:hypothetical protein [Halotia wernerae UHCC 0503]
MKIKITNPFFMDVISKNFNLLLFMQRKFSTTAAEKEKIFYTQLVKYGVEYERAAKAAKILASGKPDELLKDEEIQLVREVCRDWSIQNKRHKRLNSLVM